CVELSPRLPVELRALLSVELSPRLPVELRALLCVELSPRLPVELRALLSVELSPRLSIEVTVRRVEAARICFAALLNAAGANDAGGREGAWPRRGRDRGMTAVLSREK